MTSPYHNRLPMAYLPASRAVESVGIPSMFRSRVRGMCGININQVMEGTTPPGLDTNPYAHDFNWDTYYKKDTEKQVQTEVATPAPAPTVPKPSAGLMGLPLILGAAYLLLS